MSMMLFYLFLRKTQGTSVGTSVFNVDYEVQRYSLPMKLVSVNHFAMRYKVLFAFVLFVGPTSFVFARRRHSNRYLSNAIDAGKEKELSSNSGLESQLSSLLCISV